MKKAILAVVARVARRGLAGGIDRSGSWGFRLEEGRPLEEVARAAGE